MPGPGGGSRGGGGFRGGGGSRGGSRPSGGHRPSGGFGGGHRPGPRPGGFGGPRPVHRPRPYAGGWYGPRRSYSGGGCGCLGGAITMALVPILMVFIILFSMIGSCSNDAYPEYEYGSVGGYYDEEAFQDYADAQYARAFGEMETYEDNLLLVILTEEDNASFYWMAWVGDHIATDINWLFGDEETELGQALLECVNEENYKYSLDSNLADAMKMMTTEIKHLDLESSYDCTEERAAFASHLVNNTALPLTEETVNEALGYFTEQTGIPTVIVVEDAAAVFGQTSGQAPATPGEPDVGTALKVPVILTIVAVVALVCVVLVLRRKKEAEEDPETAERNRKYSEFDDQYK